MFLDEIAGYLSSVGVGILSRDIFQGAKAKIPDGDGPFLSLRLTGGMAPRFVHNHRGTHVQRPSAQIVVRAKSQLDALRMITEAYQALNGISNMDINGVRYIWMAARQEPTDIGLDAQSRAMFSFNIEAEKEPS